MANSDMHSDPVRCHPQRPCLAAAFVTPAICKGKSKDGAYLLTFALGFCLAVGWAFNWVVVRLAPKPPMT